MPDFDLLIRGATNHGAVGIADGKFAAFAQGSAGQEIDATGLILLPGVVDAHVHFNEPGRADWEGWETGSRAAVAGGVTRHAHSPYAGRQLRARVRHTILRGATGVARRRFHRHSGLHSGRAFVSGLALMPAQLAQANAGVTVRANVSENAVPRGEKNQARVA